MNTQGDLFTLDSPLIGDVRGERSLMAFPFFALSKGIWNKSLTYNSGQISIEVKPSSIGAATIYDKEIVLYIASLMTERIDKGLSVGQDFFFTANDFFSVTAKNPSARSYDRLSESLERLQGTQIKTNILAGGEGEEGFFSWLSEAQLKYRLTAKGERRLRAIRVRLCDWLYRALITDRRVLAYTAAYFDLAPIERRLFEVAHCACSSEETQVEFDMEQLRLQVGYHKSLRHFRYDLKAIATKNTIPGYSINLIVPEVRQATETKRGPCATEYTVVIRQKQETPLLTESQIINGVHS